MPASKVAMVGKRADVNKKAETEVPASKAASRRLENSKDANIDRRAHTHIAASPAAGIDEMPM